MTPTERYRAELAPRAEAWLREAAPAITARLGQLGSAGPGAAQS